MQVQTRERETMALCLITQICFLLLVSELTKARVQLNLVMPNRVKSAEKKFSLALSDLF